LHAPTGLKLYNWQSIYRYLRQYTTIIV